MQEITHDVGSAAVDAEWKRKFVSDIFHALSQPLTALHCSLEVALLKPNASAEQYRKALGDGVAMAERLVATSIFLREMADAEIPGKVTRQELGRLLRESLEGLAPLLDESCMKSIFKSSEDVAVMCDAEKIEKAMFLIVDQARSALRGPAELRIGWTVEQPRVRVHLEFRCEEQMAPVTMENRNLQLAAASLRSMGGMMTVEQMSAEQLRAVVVLPKARPCIGPSWKNFKD